MILVIPSVTFASWWNPFTWKILTKNKVSQPKTIQIATSTPARSEVEDLKNQLKLESEKRLELEKKIQTTKESPKTKTQTTSSQKPTTAQKSVEQKTYTLPNGAVIDINGDIIKSAPKAQVVTETFVDNKTIGINHYLSKKTCVGLSGEQYSFCVNYAFSPEVQAKQQVQQKQVQIQTQPLQTEQSQQEKQLYEQKRTELDNLINQITIANQKKIAKEEEYRAGEASFVATYCKKKEQELINNYGTRGLGLSGMATKAIEDLKITCPTEARNIFNASQNDATYPLVLQLQNMQRQFQDYNKSLYSACSKVSYNCSIYLDAAFPIN